MTESRRTRYLVVAWTVSGCALLLLAALITQPVTTHAQRSENVFDAVPPESRPRLIERLKEYVGYERTRQYEKLYELFYDRDDNSAGKENYSKFRLGAETREGVVQEFIPTFILNITIEDGDPPTFSLIGRAKVFRKGRMVQKEMAIKARLQDGEWYFSELMNSYLHVSLRPILNSVELTRAFAEAGVVASGSGDRSHVIARARG